jgi:glutaredoxin-related protein
MKDNSGFSLESILLVIGLQARTGELIIESGNSIGSMIFHGGKILQSFSPYARAIRDLLVEGGAVTEAELLEVLNAQKNEGYSPVGFLLMKAGKVSFEVIEMMVHEQIREAVKVFRKWNDLSFSFVNKVIDPFDTIHLPVYEFIDNKTLRTAMDSLSHMVRAKDESTPKAAPAS